MCYADYFVCTTSITNTYMVIKLSTHCSKRAFFNFYVKDISCKSDYVCSEQITRCRIIAKMTARSALYIGYSTLIFFMSTSTTLHGFDSERI